MRVLIAAVTAASLLVSSAFAAEVTSTSGPLAPGKPAGVKKAQMEESTVLWVLGAGLVIGGIVLVATNGGSSTPAPPAGSSGTGTSP